mgnify:CR=1 FL=1
MVNLGKDFLLVVIFAVLPQSAWKSTGRDSNSLGGAPELARAEVSSYPFPATWAMV